MLDIGGNEMLMICVVILLLFGPDKLPQAGRTIGRAIRQFRETQARMTAMVQSEIVDPLATAVQDPSILVDAATKGDVPDEEDADADTDDIASRKAAEAKSETFAERRARLLSEQAKTAGEPVAHPEGDLEDEQSTRPVEPGASEPSAADEKSGGVIAQADVAASPEAAPEARLDEEAETERLYARRPRVRARADEETPSAQASCAAPEDGSEQGGDR
ncbi:sec-independent translocation protein mttA/Hcf106 [Coriobacterium glomerans PW2]|uniref:Sec-independent translocation protein mttA/Hcf106 n=1 Tax=Coriobacterium glomerans (strain ATCC 49209 / DSM 20642 / JCM 10262 / PW2) TaxID=700015 RepID=F2N8X1_CORGP|nr:sec-independent translocation protein mttA/Hcf106 [Coriobacterium glomerans PW2]